MVDSLIRLYPSNASSFTTNGLGALSESLEAIVTEEKNGIFELQVIYPMTGARFADIELGKILTCKTNPYDDIYQPFRIYSISKPIDGKVTINAQHISYDLLGHVALPFNIHFNEGVIYINDQPTEYEEILDAAVHHLTELDATALGIDPEEDTGKHPFTFTFRVRSGDMMPSPEIFASQEPAPLRSIMGDGDDSLLGLFGGELEYNGYTVTLWSSRGVDNGVRIRYGKNMTDLQRDGTSATCYTGVFPYYKYNKNGVTVVEIIKDGSPIVPIDREDYYDQDFFDSNVNVLPLDLSSKDLGGEPTAEKLREFAEAYIEANELGKPAFSITVKYQPLSDSPEYEAFKALEEIRLCDWVTVEHEKLGVQNLAEVVKVEYNVLNNRYETIELTVNSDLKSIGKTLSNVSKSSSNAATTDDILNQEAKTQQVETQISTVAEDVNDISGEVDGLNQTVTEMAGDISSIDAVATQAKTTAESAESKVDLSIKAQRYLYSNTSASIVPAGYTLYDYIMSDGDSYLDAGIQATVNLDLTVETANGFGGTEANPTLFGYSQSGRYFSLNRNLDDAARSYFNFGNSTNNAWTYDGGKTYRVSEGKLYVDGTLAVTAPYASFATGGNIYFGGDNNNGTFRRGSKARFTKIYTGDNSRYLVPVKNGLNQVGMYDLRTNTFYETPGWTLGPETEVSGPPVPPNPQYQWEIPTTPIDYSQYWSVDIPTPVAKTKYYVCVETMYGDGHVEYSQAMEDKNNTILLGWCKDTNTVEINGGMIAANTIAADKIMANTLTANMITAGVLASNNFSQTGMGLAFNLDSGAFVSNNGAFAVDSQGNMVARNGQIGAWVLSSETGETGQGLDDVVVSGVLEYNPHVAGSRRTFIIETGDSNAFYGTFDPSIEIATNYSILEADSITPSALSNGCIRLSGDKGLVITQGDDGNYFYNLQLKSNGLSFQRIYKNNLSNNDKWNEASARYEGSSPNEDPYDGEAAIKIDSYGANLVGNWKYKVRDDDNAREYDLAAKIYELEERLSALES